MLRILLLTYRDEWYYSPVWIFSLPVNPTAKNGKDVSLLDF